MASSAVHFRISCVGGSGQSGMSSEETRHQSITTRTGKNHTSRDWTSDEKMEQFRELLNEQSIRMVCRDNPNKPVRPDEKQKGCYSALPADSDGQLPEKALQAASKMKLVDHNGATKLVIWPHGSACDGERQGQYYPAVVRGGKVVEWKDAAWRASNTIGQNQANNIKKQRQSAAKKERE